MTPVICWQAKKKMLSDLETVAGTRWKVEFETRTGGGDRCSGCRCGRPIRR